MMLCSPEQIQRQLSDAISLISVEDFPDKWADLLTGMVDRMKSVNFHVINGVLRTAHSIFKRYWLKVFRRFNRSDVNFLHFRLD